LQEGVLFQRSIIWTGSLQPLAEDYFQTFLEAARKKAAGVGHRQLANLKSLLRKKRDSSKVTFYVACLARILFMLRASLNS
jgi:hypothetical protein